VLSGSLIVFPYIPIRLLEKFLLFMKLVFEECLPENLLDFLLSGVRALPAIEPGYPNYLVYVLNHIGNDLGSGAVP